MIRARLMPGQHDMVALILALNEAEIKAEAIPVHMNQGKTATKQIKYKD